jgi:hypothetical protein
MSFAGHVIFGDIKMKTVNVNIASLLVVSVLSANAFAKDPFKAKPMAEAPVMVDQSTVTAAPAPTFKEATKKIEIREVEASSCDYISTLLASDKVKSESVESFSLSVPSYLGSELILFFNHSKASSGQGNLKVVLFSAKENKFFLKEPGKKTMSEFAKKTPAADIFELVSSAKGANQTKISDYSEFTANVRDIRAVGQAEGAIGLNCDANWAYMKIQTN